MEIASTTTVQVDLIKQWKIDWPRLENADCIMTIGSARPMEDAARIAYRELVRWLEADYGWDRLEAYLFLTQAGRIRLGNMVDPKYTLGASVAKEYLRLTRPGIRRTLRPQRICAAKDSTGGGDSEDPRIANRQRAASLGGEPCEAHFEPCCLRQAS